MAFVGKSKDASSSEFVVASNDDLLTEILLRLPVKSLLRLKSVNKHWLSLISNPGFCSLKNFNLCCATSGLFFRRNNLTEYDFVPFDTANSAPVLYEDHSGKTVIVQSCNGLLCCRSDHWPYFQDCKCSYYVCNPTTKECTALPENPRRKFEFIRGIESVYAVNLAFNSRKSPHYEVICIFFSTTVLQHFELEIYSSKTGSWRRSGNPFAAQVNFKTGVFWNNSMNWIDSWSDEGLYFNLEEERLGTMPLPPVPESFEEISGRRTRYFGGSQEHMHLIEIYGPCTTQFNVYEMEKDYSAWFPKFRVDLGPIMTAFPEAICTHLDPSNLYYSSFLTPCVVRREREEDSFLVVSIPGKLVLYNFEDKSFKKVWDFGPDRCPIGASSTPMFGWYDCFQYTESFSSCF